MQYPTAKFRYMSIFNIIIIFIIFCWKLSLQFIVTVLVLSQSSSLGTPRARISF
ncbi:hypothetical protein HanRHA438_Chr13g0599931 [Helianthus annuus]|nr:hypothetical protein HanRHA438_Chr13g0599931 [Helianthus annuus]